MRVSSRLAVLSVLALVAGCGGGRGIEVHEAPARSLPRGATVRVHVNAFSDSKESREAALDMERAIWTELERRRTFAGATMSGGPPVAADFLVDVQPSNTFTGGAFYQVDRALEVEVSDLRSGERVARFKAVGSSSHEPLADRDKQAIEAADRVTMAVVDQLEKMRR